MDRRYRDASFLRRRYVIEGQSASEIADDCGVTSSTVSRWLDRHDIRRDPRYRDREWLYDQYVEQGRRQQDIADDCGVTKSTISHWLSRHGITEGTAYEWTQCANCGDRFRYAPALRDGVYCSNACANDERKRQVTVECTGCGEPFERRASLDTEYCSMACWGEDTGANHEKFYRGCWHEQRRRAMRRDQYRCTVCGITNEAHKEQFGQELDVHHEVPVRLFESWDLPIADAHALRNLTTVCRTHHPDAPGGTVPESEE
jgi:transcriptional regulator with XRE-family HTH domain